MTQPKPAPPLKLQHKFLALGLVAVAMVATPLVQVLRYEGTQMQAVLAQQASLDPIARAVAVQYGLLAHRDTAGQVLRGQAVLEQERQLRQAEVDDRLANLGATLEALHSVRAIDEAQVLAKDWAALAQQILSRHISADASDAAHRLRVEQAVQVMDLVADASGLRQNEHAAIVLRSARQMAAAAALPAIPSGAVQRDAQYQAWQAGAQAVALQLTERQNAMQRQQRGGWVLMLALAALAAGLAFSLYRSLQQRLPLPPSPEGQTTDGQTPLRSETGRVLARLRVPGEAAKQTEVPAPTQDA